MDKYIVQKVAVKGKSVNCGTGFIVGHYLITTGHQYKEGCSEYIVFDGHIVSLPSPVFFHEWGHRENEPDLTIYSLRDISSPLILSDSDVVRDMVLDSRCYQFRSAEDAVFMECSIKVTNVYDIYFGGLSSVLLHKSSSGSPVFYKDKILGMLVAGNDKDGQPFSPISPHNFCQFLSSKKILDVVNNSL